MDTVHPTNRRGRLSPVGDNCQDIVHQNHHFLAPRWRHAIHLDTMALSCGRLVTDSICRRYSADEMTTNADFGHDTMMRYAPRTYGRRYSVPLISFTPLSGHQASKLRSAFPVLSEANTSFVVANGSTSSNQSGEGDMRRALIEADLVDSMVALADQFFYSAQIPPRPLVPREKQSRRCQTRLPRPNWVGESIGARHIKPCVLPGI